MMIKLDNISKYYYSSNAVVPALRKIKLEFDIGEFVAITGESGSGKSTLLNIISGLDTYDDGELYINGEETSYYDSADWEEYRKNKIGFVFQNYNLIEHYSVMNNVESALLIQGYGAKEAKSSAKELINRVGLGKQLHQRASKLSSGQKQRLSIARALAKNTDIIIADEPTGNLDSENGRQIMELLGELSKDKLIITVTHNLDEASQYITRKVRLHDGEIVSDSYVDQEESGEFTAADRNEAKDDDKEAEAESSRKEEIRENIDIISTDNKRPRLKSDRKIAWRFTLMNITTQPGRVILFTMFLLLTAAVSFIFLGQIYTNWDDIFIKDSSRNTFFNIDEKRIVVKKPDSSPITGEDITKFNAIKHITMADMYDYANDINYYFIDGTDYDLIYQENDPKSMERPEIVDFLVWNKFMKSSTCITDKDLVAGRLPESRNEIVIYSEDAGVLDTEQDCYFTNQNFWGYNDFYHAKVKIVGLLKQKTDQVFFSNELCNMLSIAMYDNSFTLRAGKNVLTNSYTTTIGIYPVIGDDLKYGEVKISADLAGISSAASSKEALVSADINGINTIYEAVIKNYYQLSSSRIAEINEDWFYEMYPQKSSQASIYLKDYIYTDYVLDKLKGMGYEAVSPLRISTGDYIDSKRTQRNTTILMSLIILSMISILEILIVRSIMKIRNNDFTVLGSIGMNHKTIKIMNYFEMYLYSVTSVVIILAAANITGLFRFGYLVNMLKYYNTFTYAIYIALNLITITVTVWLFNSYLKHKQKWS